MKVVDDEVMGMGLDVACRPSFPEMRMVGWKVVVPMDHHAGVLSGPERQRAKHAGRGQDRERHRRPPQADASPHRAGH